MHPSVRQHNTPIHVECKTLRHVVASSAEAETGALFHNAQNIIAFRQALECLGHKQPPTPLKTDNSTACGYVNKNIKIKKSKSWDMRYHWLRDRELRNFLKFSGIKALKMMRTITPNIFLRNIIKISGLNMYSTYLNVYLLSSVRLARVC